MATLSLSERQWTRYTVGLAGEVTRRLALRREALIVEHLVMVERIARHLLRMLRRSIPHVELDDLIGEGRLGLVQAADRYQSQDGPFVRYAYFRVRGAILDANKRRAWRDQQHCQLHDFVEDESEYFLDPRPGPDVLAMGRVRAERFARALAEVPESERVLLRRMLSGERATTIASSHGRSTYWVYVRVRAARLKVTATLRGEPWPLEERAAS